MLFGQLPQIHVYWLVCWSVSQPGQISWYVGWSVNPDRQADMLVSWSTRIYKTGLLVVQSIRIDRLVLWSVSQPRQMGWLMLVD